ncbi:MAG: hypothetical protein WD049_07900 [Candidatus Paceibacterota bacterium]
MDAPRILTACWRLFSRWIRSHRQCKIRFAVAGVGVAAAWLVSVYGCSSSVMLPHDLPHDGGQQTVQIEASEAQPDPVLDWKADFVAPAPRNVPHRVERQTLPATADPALKPAFPVAVQADRSTQVTASLSEIFREHAVIQRHAASYTRRLLERLPARDAAHISLLHQLHSTGHFLRELERWVEESGNGDLVEPDARTELRKLKQQWEAWELTLVAAMNTDGSAQER